MASRRETYGVVKIWVIDLQNKKPIHIFRILESSDFHDTIIRGESFTIYKAKDEALYAQIFTCCFSDMKRWRICPVYLAGRKVINGVQEPIWQLFHYSWSWKGGNLVASRGDPKKDEYVDQGRITASRMWPEGVLKTSQQAEGSKPLVRGD